MNKELKMDIVNATFSVYKKKGFKFTMDDIAKEISISKKTIYNTFRSKDELFIEVVDYFFDKIKQEEKKILRDASLSTDEKLRRIMKVLPDGYRDLDLRQVNIVRDRFPNVYRRIQKRLEIDWENTIYLIQKGVDEGVFKEVNIPLFKMMFQASVEQFFQDDILLEQNMEYAEALNEIVDLLIDGLRIKEQDA